MKKNPKIGGGMYDDLFQAVEKAFREKNEAAKIEGKPNSKQAKGKAPREDDEDVDVDPGFDGGKLNSKQAKGKALLDVDPDEDVDPSPVFVHSLRNILVVSKYKESLITDAEKKIRSSPLLSSSYAPPPSSLEDDQKLIERNNRFGRAHEAFLFTQDYKLVKGIKCCISHEFKHVTRPGEYCFDSSWVAVHGFNTICMVTCRKPVDMTRLDPYYQACRNDKEALLDFPEAVISEVECIPYNDFVYNQEILRKECSSKVAKPFGAVSLVLTTEKSWEKAIDPVVEFLEQKMKDVCSSFTDYQTLQTAIGAYQCICPDHHVLRAQDILVTIMDVSCGGVNHLDIDIIKEELEIFNGHHPRTNSPELPLLLRHPRLQARLRDSGGPML